MDNIFHLDKKFCKNFKEKNNPELYQSKLPEYIKKIVSTNTIQFAKEVYFKERLCFLHNVVDYLFYFNYPNIEVVDENALLFFLKIYRLYEIQNKKILDYQSKKDSRLIFNDNVKLEQLFKYALILGILEGKEIDIVITAEDNIILQAIKLSRKMDFENIKSIDDIFNGYLRWSIFTPEFFKKMTIEKIPRNRIEQFLGKEFKKLKEADKNYVSNMHKQFILQYNSLMEKLNKFYKTAEYKKFIKSLRIKKFKFPLKEYFGTEKPLTYQMFKNILDQFENEVREKIGTKK